MKIAVLSGSPKGNRSITLKYVEYLQKQFPQVEFCVHHVSQNIKQLEKSHVEMDKVMDEVRAADGVLWAFPVYVYLVPSGLKRFVELINEGGYGNALAGKYTAVMSTSIHFFDNLAHTYMHAVIDDLDMKYVGYHSAAMNDLLEERGQQEVRLFMGRFVNHIEKQFSVYKSFKPINKSNFIYESQAASHQTDLQGKRLLLITDASEGSQAARMQQRFLDSLTGGEIEIIDLNQIKMIGGCVGCMKCAFDNECAYEDKDDIKAIYNEKIPQADIVIYVGTIVDRFLSATWKRFIDRRFMKTHQPLLKGKQVGSLIAGSLNEVSNLRMFLEAEAQVGGGNLAGIVTDECGNSALLDTLISQFAENVAEMAKDGYVSSKTFLGVGGMKIFRDEVWGKLRFVFQGDHRYYKKHGVYDFPQKDWKTRIRNLFMMALLKIPKIRKETRNDMINLMLKPFQTFVDGLR